MKCLNTKCNNISKKGQCREPHEYYNCANKIVPTHTPNYAEEQLEHAKGKENRCYNESCVSNNKNGLCGEPKHITMCDIRDIDQPTPINYEEEYNKLKKGFEELNEDYTNVAKSLRYSELKSKDEKIEELEKRLNNQGIRIKTDGNQIQKLLKENEDLKISIQEGIESVKECGEALKNKNKRIEDLENINKDINNTRELIHEEMIKFANENTELKEEYEKDKKANREQFEEIAELKNKISVLKYLEEVQESDNRDTEHYKKIGEQNQKLKETVKTLAILL